MPVRGVIKLQAARAESKGRQGLQGYLGTRDVNHHANGALVVLNGHTHEFFASLRSLAFFGVWVARTSLVAIVAKLLVLSWRQQHLLRVLSGVRFPMCRQRGGKLKVERGRHGRIVAVVGPQVQREVDAPWHQRSSESGAHPRG